MAEDKTSRVIEAATSVFLRYGFRRATMGDIASASGISRPALYLLFCNKERVFEAVLQKFWAGMLDEIRTGMVRWNTPIEKLRFAFECWAVKPFAMMAGSPDAKDLIHAGPSCAGETVAQGYRDFEAILIAILEEFPGARSADKPALEQIAHVLATSVHGFKDTAKGPEELRSMIDVLLGLTVASLKT